jgi:tRNA (adenine22-N1)-methyltransferase
LYNEQVIARITRVSGTGIRVLFNLNIRRKEHMIVLNNRLLTVADMVIPGEQVADIGADHALLPIYLIENHIVPRVIIGELADGPFRRACRSVQDNRAQNRIDLRQGNGLQVLDYGEVKSVVMAGMGADTMVAILADEWNKAASFQRYVFQPMSKAHVLRRRLASRGWLIEQEHVGLDDGRLFLVIVSQPGNCPYPLSELEIEIGPYILKADKPLKRRLIQDYINKYKAIYSMIVQSQLYQNTLLAQDYKEKVERLEEILGGS